MPPSRARSSGRLEATCPFGGDGEGSPTTVAKSTRGCVYGDSRIPDDIGAGDVCGNCPAVGESACDGRRLRLQKTQEWEGDGIWDEGLEAAADGHEKEI